MAVFPSFIFDSSKGESPQTIAMKRALAAQIMGGFGNRQARNVGEGVGNAFASLGQGITANVMNRRAAAGEEAGHATAGDLRQQLINSMMGQSSFPAAPNPGNTSSMATMPAGESADYIRSGLQQRGLPSHVADAFVLNMQDESGLNPGINERNPVVPGSRGGFGLYQLTGPRRRAYEAFAAQRGVDPSDVDAQLDFLMTELQGPEARAAQSILSAPDTGTAAQAIVNDFLRPAPEHRQRRASRYAAYQGAPAGGNAVDAVNALGAAQPVPVAETEADILAQEQAMAQQDPAAFAAQGAMPQAAPMQQQPMQVAQAGGFPEMAGRDPSRPPPPDLNMLMQVLSNPFMDEGTKAYAQAVLNQHMQAQDPMRQLQLERAQLENAALRNPTPKDTDDIREYNYAREQGYQGSFTDFMTDMRRAGATNVNVGGDGAPGLGKLSPDYGYVLDPETRQPVIDPATGLPRSAPIPGSPAAIAAEQAAAEQERLAGAQTRSDADKAETTLDATGSVLDIMRDAETPATGTLSRPFALYSGTPAGKVRSYVKTLQSGVALGAMQRLKEMSATGATGFGALSAPELDLLINDIGALDPDNTEPEIFIKTVERIRDRSRRVAHDIAKNVSPERIQELGLQPFIDAFKASEAKGNRTRSGVQWSIE